MRPTSSKRPVNHRGPPARQQGAGDFEDRGPPPNDRQEWLLDQALMETFPASDPISPAGPAATDDRRSSPTTTRAASGSGSTR